MSDEQSGQSGRYRFADLALDIGQRRVWRGSTEIRLPKLSFNLLLALVESAPDALSVDEIMDRAWDGAVVSPATVAKRVELLREALGDDSDQPRYVALVRGHGYRLIPATVPESQSTHRAWYRIAVASVAVFAILAATLILLMGEADKPPEKTIAVLPFASLTGDEQDEIFADGLTDELSHTLARLGDLRVSGRMSSFYFKDRSAVPQTIGETLDVAHILEGSIRRSGDSIRVTAKLVSTADGYQLWSASYDREMRDIIEIQEDIARAVALKLRASILDQRALSNLRDPKISPEAYELYLRGVSLAPYGKTRDLGEAQSLLEQVTDMAPDFAPGWNLLAAIHGRRLAFGDPEYDVSPRESMRMMDEAVNRALELDPESGESYANRGGALWVFERDAAKAAPLIERALHQDPWNLDIVSFAADFAKYIGRADEALELEEVLVAADPLCDICRSNLAASYLHARRYDDAETQYRVLQARGRGYHFTLGVIHLLRHEPEQALASFRQLGAFEHLRLLGEAMAVHDLERFAEAERLITDVERRYGASYPLDLGRALAYVGETDRALDWLDAALPAEILQLQMTYSHPLYDGLRNDARWLEFLARIDRSPGATDNIEFSLDAVRERLGLRLP